MWALRRQIKFYPLLGLERPFLCVPAHSPVNKPTELSISSINIDGIIAGRKRYDEVQLHLKIYVYYKWAGGGDAVVQWLRCYATNRKVAGSILAGVIGIFHWYKNPSDRTMALGSTQPLNRNEYQEYFLGVKAVGAQGWQPYHHPVPLSWNLGTLTYWNPLGHSRPVTGLLYLYLYKWAIRCRNLRMYLHNSEGKRDMGRHRIWWGVRFNLLKPNVNYSGRTSPLTSKVAFYIFIQLI